MKQTGTTLVTVVGALAVSWIACKASPSSQPTAPRPTSRSVDGGRAEMEPLRGSSPSLDSEAGAPPHPFAVRFDTETRDAAWASETESGIRQVVAGIKGATLRSVECKMTICRIDVLHDNAQSTRAFDREFGQGLHRLLHWNGGQTAIGSDPIHFRTGGWIILRNAPAR